MLAEMTIDAWVEATVAEAVIVAPFKPNETLFELLSTMALRLLDVVPAETLTFVRDVATDAVIVAPFNPKLTPFEFEKVTALRLLDVVPALRLKL